jgi:hypothetical protein
VNIFNLFPEWSGGIDIRYAHNTVIYTATNKKEQRSSLRSLPARTISFKFFEDALLTTKQINQLRYTLRSEIAVPIYSEAFKVTNTGSLLGITSLISTNLQYLFNLQKYLGGLIVVDRTGVIPHEFRTISYASDTNVLIDPIESALDAANAIFYPAMIGMVDDLRGLAHITDNLGEMNLTFNEKQALDTGVSFDEWQDSDSGDEYQDSDVGAEYQNI